MRRSFFLYLSVTVTVLIFVLPLAVVGNDGAGKGAELEDRYPRYGFGSQFVYPAGGISSRFWLTSRLGGEANAIVWSSTGSGVTGTLSLRLLSKLSDGEAVDFYLATGGAYNFGSRYSEISLVGTGGISFRLISDSFQVNLEFGMAGQGIERFGPTFGSGFHYYF